MIHQSICHSLLYPQIFRSNIQHNTEHLRVLAHFFSTVSPAILRYMLYEFSYPVLLPISEAPDILTIFGSRG